MGRVRASCKPSRTSAMTERCSSRCSSARLSSGVAWHTYGTYHAIHDGKKKWSDLGAGVAVGVGLLILIIYLVTKATAIM